MAYAGVAWEAMWEVKSIRKVPMHSDVTQRSTGTVDLFSGDVPAARDAMLQQAGAGGLRRPRRTVDTGCGQ